MFLGEDFLAKISEMEGVLGSQFILEDGLVATSLRDSGLNSRAVSQNLMMLATVAENVSWEVFNRPATMVTIETERLKIVLNKTDSAALLVFGRGDSNVGYLRAMAAKAMRG